MVDEKKVRRGDGGRRPSTRNPLASDGEVGHVAGALRSAYEETVGEDIPAEFLDLLGKLK